MLKSQVPSQCRNCSKALLAMLTVVWPCVQWRLWCGGVSTKPRNGLLENLSEMLKVRFGIASKYVISSKELETIH